MFWKVLNSKKSTYEPIISDVSNNKLEHTVDPLEKSENVIPSSEFDIFETTKW